MLSESLYPLGTVVLLKEGLQKLLIVGRGAIFPNPSTGEEQFSDYVSVLYPVGLDPNQTIFFNHTDIDKVIFEGYKDDEEERFLEIYRDWKKTLTTKTIENEESFGF